MKIHRFIYPFSDNVAEIYIKDESLVKQMTRVLKLSVGEKIALINGAGLDAHCTIKEILKREILVFVDNIEKKEKSDKKITLYCAIVKRENFELITQKATELGVSVIVPIISARTIKTGLNENRLIKIIHEAVEQSGQSTIPELLSVQDFKDAMMQSTKENDATVLFEQSGNKNQLSDKKSIGIFIGPEGGWTEEELGFAKDSGCMITSLGVTTLRAETAAIVAVFNSL